MLLTAIYHILKNKEPYHPDLYRQAAVRPTNREITVEQAILWASSPRVSNCDARNLISPKNTFIGISLS
ncbi:hypothetical protein D3C74_233910 [compost metagenome]